MPRRKRKKTSKDFVITVDTPTPKRYEWVDTTYRKVKIDMRCVRKPAQPNPIHRRAVRKFKSPEHLKALCDEYFASCEGVIYNPKTGSPYIDKNGNPVTGQIKPYTISGLALYLDIDKSKLYKYARGDMDDIGYDIDTINQYSTVMRRAKQRIEEYVEGNLYTREGYNGSRFVLDCAFNWVTQRDRCEIDTQIATRELKKKEYELKAKLLDSSEEEDSNITINITRASKKER